MFRLLLAVVAVAILGAALRAEAAAQPATPTLDPFGPSPAECQVAPRSDDDLRALVGDATAVSGTPPAAAATTVRVAPPAKVDLPPGTPADAATVAAVTSTVRQLAACLNAGDFGRYLSVFTDDELRGTAELAGVARAVAAGRLPAEGEPLEPSQRFHFTGLHHARVLTDGRVAAILPPGFLGVPELFVFLRVGERWLIDDIAPILDESVPIGVVGTTFTGEHRLDTLDGRAGGYSYGVAWSSGWQAMAAPAVGFEGGDLALTDGVSIVVFGDPLGDPAAGLAACVAPDFGDPAADVWGVGLNPAFFDRQRGAEVAVDATGRELQGGTGDRAFVVYDVTYYPTGGATAGEAARQPSVAVYDAADDPTDGEVTGSDPTGEPSAAVYATETDHSDGGATETRLAGQPYRLYLECREMAGGAWVLGIAQLTPTAAYDAAVAAREALLATIDG